MFHVPENARYNNRGLDAWNSTSEDGNNGMFTFSSPEPGWTLFMIASDGGDWEHVSVSVRRGGKIRVPTWKEMCFVKRVFWDAEDVVMQLHPKESEYVNTCPDCLHLWRPLKAEIPMPPAEFVGFTNDADIPATEME